METLTAVLEYEFRAYHAPTDYEAIAVDATACHADEGLSIVGDGPLADMRCDLEEAGYALHGTQLLETHPRGRGGRYYPRWREVWARQQEEQQPGQQEEQQPGLSNESWGALSPEAQKAQEQAAGRARGWWPYIARTQTMAIIQRPRKGSRQTRRRFAEYVREKLPSFRFDSARDRWEGPLDQLSSAYQALKPANLSPGAAELLGL